MSRLSEERAAERAEIIENINVIFFSMYNELDQSNCTIKGLAWALEAMEPRFNELDDIRKL